MMQFNCFSLNSIGPMVEMLTGPRRYLAVYFTSALAGILLLPMFENIYMVVIGEHCLSSFSFVIMNSSNFARFINELSLLCVSCGWCVRGHFWIGMVTLSF